MLGIEKSCGNDVRGRACYVDPTECRLAQTCRLGVDGEGRRRGIQNVVLAALEPNTDFSSKNTQNLAVLCIGLAALSDPHFWESWRRLVQLSGILCAPLLRPSMSHLSTFLFSHSRHSQPEDLNTVTIQSIMNADLDSSTTEWIEAQLSSGALGVKASTGEMKWNRLREGLQGVVHRLATEVS